MTLVKMVLFCLQTATVLFCFCILIISLSPVLYAGEVPVGSAENVDNVSDTDSPGSLTLLSWPTILEFLEDFASLREAKAQNLMIAS